MRFVLVLLLTLAACGKPCAFICADDNDCAAGHACVSHEACLPKCISCGSACVQDTFHNCETCGIACAPGQVCSGGRCVASCGAGLTDCDSSCYDLQTDRLNCGACGHLCGPSENCSAGSCRALATCG
ncbi:MAG: hypothetical protein ACXWLM_00115 [Myxococcales bacterium]